MSGVTCQQCELSLVSEWGGAGWDGFGDGRVAIAIGGFSGGGGWGWLRYWGSSSCHLGIRSRGAYGLRCYIEGRGGDLLGMVGFGSGIEDGGVNFLELLGDR